MRATKNKDGEWEAQKEVANVNLRQGTFSKKIKENDVKITNEVITAKDLGENAHRYGNGEWKSDKGGSAKSENIKNRYKLGGEKTDDGHLDASLDQIDISDGRSLLSRTVKFKSWLGIDDSTFLTFIKKVDVFNNASDISTKQEAYINVIYQGYAWLAAFPNLNDKKANKKRAIINEIISGSISNFAEVELTYLAFEDAYKSFRADSSIDILNSSDFSGIDAFKKLRAFLKEKKIWEDQHNSPVKNKNHSKEEEAMKKIENLGTLEVKSSEEYNLIPGVLKISNPTLKLENLGKKITINSGVSLAAGVNFEAAQLNASGEFTIEINNENIWNSTDSEFKIATAKLTDGEVTGSFLSQEFIIKSVKYSTESPNMISAQAFAWEGNILGKTARMNFLNPKITDQKGFEFSFAWGNLSEINYGQYVSFKNIELIAQIESPGNYLIKGDTDATINPTIPGIDNSVLQGHFSITRNADGTLEYSISEGNLNATFLGQQFQAKGFSYTSVKPNEISAQAFAWEGNILGKTARMNFLNPKITDQKGFEFSFAWGNLSEINYGQYVSFKNIELIAQIESPGNYLIKGDTDATINPTIPGIDNSVLQGHFSITRNADGTLEYSISEGNLNATFLGQIININGVNYSSENPKHITALSAGWKGTILQHPGALFILNPKITENEGFNFKKITGVIYDLNYGQYVAIDFLEIGIEKNGSKYKISGELDTTVTPVIQGLDNVQISGHFSASGYSDGTEIKHSITNGNLSATFLGQIININGVNYSSENPNEISAKSVGWKGTILGYEGALFIVNPTITNDEGFSFKKGLGRIYDLNYGKYLQIDSIWVGINKENEKYKVYGAVDNLAANLKTPIPGLSSVNASGNFTASGYDDGTEKIFTLDNGDLSATLFGNSLVLKGVKYSTQSPDKISAQEAKLTLNVFGEEGLEPVIEGPRIDENGFDFDSAEINTNDLLKTDLGAFSLKADKLTLLKSKTKGYEAKVDGKISLNLGENSPINLTGNAKGAISYNFKSKAKKVDFEKAEVSIPNPFSVTLPKDLGIPWPVEMTMGIPIFPGLNVEIGFYLDGSVEMANEIKITIVNNKENLNVKISSKIAGELLAGVLLGLQLGSSFLASLSVRLKGGGKLTVDTLVEFAKEFNYNKNVNSTDKPNAHNFLYDTELIAKLEASLEIVGRLLYFFKKKYNKTIGEYEIGRYHFSNNPEADHTDINPTKNNFTDKDDVASKMDIPEGYTLDQIENIDQSTRFKDDEVSKVIDSYKIEDGENLENKVSLLSSYGKFMKNRIDINSLSVIFNQTPDKEIDSKSRDELKELLQKLGPKINSKTDLVKKYSALIGKNAKNKEIKVIVDDHNKRKIFFDVANKFKGKYLHSDFWGDESKQSTSTNWLYRGELKKEYKKLNTSFKNNKTALNKDLVSLENNYIKEIHKFKKSESSEELKNKIKASELKNKASKSALAS